MVTHKIKTIILMSTYNGEKYIEELLNSIYNQVTNCDIELIIRDDGSKDNTCNIIKEWNKKLHIKLVRGRNCGPRESFYKLIQISPDADYYAFCDQDDIWHIDKIESAINTLRYSDSDPKLYFSNVRLVDYNGNSLGKYRDKKIPKMELESLFVSNPALGCTIVFNNRLMKQLKRLSFENFFMHDVATIILAKSIGKVVYDSDGKIDYRQHRESVTQGHNKIVNIINKIEFWFFKPSISISKQAAKLISLYSSQITQDKYIILNEISKYRIGFARFKLINNKKYRVDSRRCNRSFILRVIFGIA